MSRNKPWAPKKPKQAIKCKRCKGEGKAVYWHRCYQVNNFRMETLTCHKCGGKGYM